MTNHRPDRVADRIRETVGDHPAYLSFDIDGLDLRRGASDARPEGEQDHPRHEAYRADPEDQPAGGDVVHRAGHVGEQLRVAVAVARDQRADLDALRLLGPVGESAPIDLGVVAPIDRKRRHLEHGSHVPPGRRPYRIDAVEPGSDRHCDVLRHETVPAKIARRKGSLRVDDVLRDEVLRDG